jgi:hypothetical protein
MGRNFMLSVIFLMLAGGTGFALPDWIDIYNFYGNPSAADTHVFRPLRDSFASVNQPHTVLQLREGVVLPNGTNNYFYKIPSSGSLDLTVADIWTSNVSPVFMPVPEGGFGPSTTSFQNRDSFSSVKQTYTPLQLKDRWLFDFLPGGHPRHPHHASRRKHLLNEQ